MIEIVGNFDQWLLTSVPSPLSAVNKIRVRVSVGVCAVHVSRILKCRDRESLFCMLRYNIVLGPYLCTGIFLSFPCVVSVVENLFI